jgi:hypothetical protein
MSELNKFINLMTNKDTPNVIVIEFFTQKSFLKVKG